MEHRLKTKQEYEKALIDLAAPTENDPVTIEEELWWHELNVAVKEFEHRVASLEYTGAISRSGYAGMMPNGNIVDRRKHPEAIPIQANRLFNVPTPKKV